jgi:hypothetical protein
MRRSTRRKYRSISLGLNTGTRIALHLIKRLLPRVSGQEAKDEASDSRPRQSGRIAATLSLLPLVVFQVAPSPADRLEPVQRAKLFGSLALLALGGVAMIVLAWLMLRVGRRSSRREDMAVESLRKKRSDADDWAAKRLVESTDEEGDSGSR